MTDTRQNGTAFSPPRAGRAVFAGKLRVALLSGLAVLAMLLGATLISLANGADAEPGASEPLAVDVLTLDAAASTGPLRRFVGLIEYAQEVGLAFDLSGTIEARLVEEGDRVKAGAEIARLDTARLMAQREELLAERAALDARRDLAQRTLDRQRVLERDGFASEQRFDEARLTLAELRASLARIDAGLNRIDIEIGKSTLRAPFDGAIAGVMLDQGATVSSGTPIAMLLETRRPRLRVSVPDDLVAPLSPGQSFTVAVGARRLTGRLAAIRPDTDPITRGRILLIDLPGDSGLSKGETAQLILPSLADEPADQAPQFWVPMTALREGERGLWTLLSVARGENGSVAALETVEILDTDGERVLVRGTLQSGQQIVQNGLHRLTPGTAIRPVREGRLAAAP